MLDSEASKDFAINLRISIEEGELNRGYAWLMNGEFHSAVKC